MIIRTSLITALLVATATSVNAASSCTVRAAQIWAASPGQKLTVEALADGPSCAQAVVTLVIRNSKGEALWFEASDTRYILTFTEGQIANIKAMTAMLVHWIEGDDRLRSTDTLPEWKKGADAPSSGEFPFYVHDGITQQSYNVLRAAKHPMFCYVAGMESEACLVLTPDGTITAIGSQSFPG